MKIQENGYRKMDLDVRISIQIYGWKVTNVEHGTLEPALECFLLHWHFSGVASSSLRTDDNNCQVVCVDCACACNDLPH